MPASQVFTGARAVFKLGGSPVGYALGVNGTTNINYQPLNVLGHLEVIEHVPVAYTVEMNANLSRLGSQTRMNAGASFPGLREGGDNDGSLTSPQIMPAFGTDGLNIIKSGELAATIYDRVTQKSLYTIKGVKCSQKGWDITAAGAVAENCVFVARISVEDGENDGTIGDVAAA